MSRLLLLVALCVSLPVGLWADVLILRDGTRVQGELLSIRNGVIEFEESRGRGRTLRLDREEVARIEFDSEATDDRSFAGGGSGGSGGRPSGMRERQVTVNANVGWTDTGIDVRAGQTVYFESTGQVRWGRDRRDGPAGENNSPQNPNRPIPNRPAAALIGRVGDSAGDAFFIGEEQGAIRIRSGGRLFLGVNDDVLDDNTGNFRVVVHY
ncbi:MAG TPA: hypothetical protein VNJ02_10105 [Vicinamibacterales bacterium]|nr:hypothetical protein [Vicinamibacterales bacterium]